MAKMIQVRNVPEHLHRELTRRAAARGQTLTAYVQEILEREVARPPVEDVLARIRTREVVDVGGTTGDLIRDARREAAR